MDFDKIIRELTSPDGHRFFITWTPVEIETGDDKPIRFYTGQVETVAFFDVPGVGSSQAGAAIRTEMLPDDQVGIDAILEREQGVAGTYIDAMIRSLEE